MPTILLITRFEALTGSLVNRRIPGPIRLALGTLNFEMLHSSGKPVFGLGLLPTWCWQTATGPRRQLPLLAAKFMAGGRPWLLVQLAVVVFVVVW